MSAPVFDAATTFTDTSFASSFTTSHTTGGSNRLLMTEVAPSYSNSGVPTGVTYAGAALTGAPSSPVTDGNNYRLYVFYKKAPASGANNVVVSMSPTSQFVSGASASYKDVDQTTPFGTETAAFHDGGVGSSTSAKAAVSSAAGELVFLAAAHGFFDGFFANRQTATAVATSGCTERAQIRNAQTGGQATRTMVGDAPGAGTVTEGWDINFDLYWQFWGVSLKGVASGTNTPISVGGTVTPAGSLVKATAATKTGTAAPAGTLRRSTAATKLGASTPAGALARSTAAPKAASLSSSGAVGKTIAETKLGAIAPAGTKQDTIAIARVGSVTPAGAVQWTFGKALAGAITLAGTLQKSITKALVGLLSWIGSLVTEGGQPPELLTGTRCAFTPGDERTTFTPYASKTTFTPDDGEETFTPDDGEDTFTPDP
jgi:hypothetical protein